MQLVGQVLLGDVVTLEVVRELVADTDPVLLHPAIAGGAQVVGDRQRALVEHVGHRRPVGLADRVALGGRADVHGRVGKGVLRLRQADPVERLRRRDRHLEGPRVGVPDVLGCADDEPPGDELRVLAGRDHRGEPIEGGVGVVAAQALDEGGHRVVVAVAGPVVAEHALLGRDLDVLEARADMAVGVADPLVLGQRRRALEHVERGPGVAARERDEVLEGVVAERHAAVRPERAGQPALLVGERPAHDRADLLVGQGLEPPDAHPREQRRVDLEVGVLRRRADQGDRAVLDVGQQGILLGLVEAMDLVEEQHAPGAVEVQPLLRLGDRGADVGHAGHDRGQRGEVRADLTRQQPRQARLAGPRRPPQQQRRQVAARDAPAERAALADEVRLPDELVEVPGAHARRQRLPLGRWLEEGFGTGAGGSPRGWHAADGSAGAARPASVQSGPSPAKCAIAHRPEQDQDERAADDRDPPDVACHVGVFLGRRDLEA